MTAGQAPTSTSTPRETESPSSWDAGVRLSALSMVRPRTETTSGTPTATWSKACGSRSNVPAVGEPTSEAGTLMVIVPVSVSVSTLPVAALDAVSS